MSTSRHHAEWLSLIEVSGPFLSLPVLLRVFPQGVDAHDSDHFRDLRAAYEAWEESTRRRFSPAEHRAWIRFVLEHTLDLPAEVIAEGKTRLAHVDDDGVTFTPHLDGSRHRFTPETSMRIKTELGADVIIPYMALRSVSRPAGDKVTVKVDRWQKIATEASRCTGSTLVTRVGSLLSFEEMLSLAEPSSRKMIFWEEEQHRTIRDALNDPAFDVVGGYFVVVGPEGGFLHDEVAKASEAGFAPVTLGRQILKVETAAMAILAIIQYEKGIFSQYTERGAR